MARRRDPQEFLDRFAQVRRCITLAAGQAYAAVDVGILQAKLLRHLGQARRSSQAELARATESDPTLTGRVLQALLERGLVRRERSEEDRRQYLLELSPAGRRAQARVKQLRDALATRIVGVLDERDLDDFDRIAGKILAAFAAPEED
jgi:DNA-binding MarR family transcriptional regulator